jgi:hypothetical protein
MQLSPNESFNFRFWEVVSIIVFETIFPLKQNIRCMFALAVSLEESLYATVVMAKVVL